MTPEIKKIIPKNPKITGKICENINDPPTAIKSHIKLIYKIIRRILKFIIFNYNYILKIKYIKFFKIKWKYN